MLDLDRGLMTVDEFERAVDVHVAQFASSTVAPKLRKLVEGMADTEIPSFGWA
jgi:hypothetical protein